MRGRMKAYIRRLWIRSLSLFAPYFKRDLESVRVSDRLKFFVGISSTKAERERYRREYRKAKGYEERSDRLAKAAKESEELLDNAKSYRAEIAKELAELRGEL
jgi:hypothetical protein